MRDKSVSVSLYHEHMSHHMEQLALLAVPDSGTGGRSITSAHPEILSDFPVDPSGNQRVVSTGNFNIDRNKHASIMTRQWFVPVVGIDRQVIITDIKRCLGKVALQGLERVLGRMTA